MQRIMVLFTCGLMIGILLAKYLFAYAIFWFICAAIMLIYSIYMFFNDRWSIFITVFLGLVVGGLLFSVQVYQVQSWSRLVEKDVRVTGKVVSLVQKKGKIVSFNLEVDKVVENNNEYRGFDRVIKVGIKNLDFAIHYGDKISLIGYLTEPDGIRNPGGFDYQKYLNQQGIYYELYSDSFKVNLEKKSEGLLKRIYDCCQEIINKLYILIPENEAGLITAVVFGDKSGLEREAYQAIQQAGLVHIFAVSGLHVGFILTFLLIFLRYLPISRTYKTFIIVPCLLFYGTLTLWTPSVTRAIIMALISWGAYIWGKFKDVYTALALAALFILVNQPQTLFNPGFQLSFLTTWGLIYLYPLIDNWFKFLPKWRSIIVISICAWLVTAPLTIYYFHQISFIAPFVNILAVGLVGVAVNLAFVGIILSFVSISIAKIPLSFSGAILWSIELACRWLSTKHWSSINIGKISIYIIILYFFLLIFLRNQEKLDKYRALIKNISIMLIIVLISYNIYFPNYLIVNFLDVGQGDATLIITPKGRSILIDGGGSPNSDREVGKNIIVPVLKYYGLRQIDLMVMSHGHDDHSKGLREILGVFPVKLLLTGQQQLGCISYFETINKAKELGIPVQLLKKGDRLSIENSIKLDVLNPIESNSFRENDDNNQSLVFNFSYHDIDFLFTGDIENEVVNSLGGKLNSEIIKVPHHGSNGSLGDNFYNKVNPKIAIISVGTNRYGHPGEKVLNYFEKNKIEYYRTDEKGAIIVKSDGRNLWVNVLK